VKACELQLHHHIYRRQSHRTVRQVKFHDQQENAERMTRSIKTSERAKRATTREDVEKNEFNQICREQRFL
jgi:hypothetical protein